MLTPQISTAAPNALYAKNINISCELRSGVPWGIVNSVELQQAAVDPTTGAWSDSGLSNTYSLPIQFTFDTSGNVTGLPDELSAYTTDFINCWNSIVQVISDVNITYKIA